MHRTDRDYEIRIAGESVAHELLEDVPALERVSRSPSTILVCHVEDPAELHGVLSRVASLGLDVIEVRLVPRHDDGPPFSTGGP
jgi:hypothetical protein